MGGKSYFCDYCRCYTKNDINVRKKHNSGVTHTIFKVSYMRRYEDPRRLLAEESAKVPCTRYLKGYCKFDLYCQFSHFNEKQLQELRRIAAKEQKSAQTHGKEKHAASKLKQQLLWRQLGHNDLSDGKRTKLIKRLPASLQPINFSKLNDKHFELQWGQ